MTVEFIKPLTVVTNLTAKGMIFEIISDREAVVEGFLFDDRQRLCAKSKGNYALIGADVAKKLKFIDKDDIRRFAPVFKE
jgi:acyl-coenzyme A thioesterase PaaI-like protein